MRYVIARYNEYQREMAYRFYISESLFAQGQNKHLTKPYSEILDTLKNGFKEEPSGDEIAIEVIKNAGLKVV